jgi:hypothetical protein
MPRLLETVDDLIAAVRAQLDETNQDAVGDATDILPSLNRGQDYACDILARYYPEPLLTHSAVTLTAGTAEYDIPEDAFEDRLVKVEITVAGSQREVQRINYADISNYETSSNIAIPSYYCLVGRQYRLVPTPDGSYAARIWYLRAADKLVQSQGRIQIPNATSNYVLLDTVGDDITTTSDTLASYVNVIDAQTGLIKKSFQVLSIVGNRVTFRSTPLRSTVLGRTISSSFISTDIERDDYISLVQGTCVVQPLGANITNFCIQYAVNEINRKLGMDTIPEKQMLSDLEQQVQRSYIGREPDMRIRKVNRVWGPVHRWWNNTTR